MCRLASLATAHVAQPHIGRLRFNTLAGNGGADTGLHIFQQSNYNERPTKKTRDKMCVPIMVNQGTNPLERYNNIMQKAAAASTSRLP